MFKYNEMYIRNKKKNFGIESYWVNKNEWEKIMYNLDERDKYMNKIVYLDINNTLEENEIIYKNNNSVRRHIYYPKLDFEIIRKGYSSRDLLKDMKPDKLIFSDYKFGECEWNKVNIFDLKNFIILENSYELELKNITFSRAKNFMNYLNSDKIIKLNLIDCVYYDCYGEENNPMYNRNIKKLNKYNGEDMYCLEGILNNLVLPFVCNLKEINISNFINVCNHSACHNEYTPSRKVNYEKINLNNIKYNIDRLYICKNSEYYI
jgi:hypothetical protein